MRLILAQDGSIIRTTDLDPWGYEYEPIRRNVTGTDTKWKFLGKEQDSESGYYDLEARKYQPTLGLFLGAEPLYEEWFGISPFSYALNNPLLYEDREGLSPTERKWNSETGQYEYWAEEEIMYANSPALSLPSLWAIEFMAHKSGNYKMNITSNPYWQEQASGRVEEAFGIGDVFGGVGSKLAMSGTLGNIAKNSSIFSLITGKIARQMAKRGWTKELIHQTVNNPYTTRQATNKATGNASTAYFQKDGSYVVKDEVTNEIIQISDRSRAWLPDPSIINPYTP